MTTHVGFSTSRVKIVDFVLEELYCNIDLSLIRNNFSLVDGEEENKSKEKEYYEKIMILMIALVMALSAMPISAAESTPMEIANPDIEVLTSFVSCPTGCGVLVVLTCSGRMKSDTDRAFTCNISEHNDYEPCNHYKVIYYDNVKCNSCDTPENILSALLNQKYPNEYYTTHTHSYKHVFSTGYGTYRTEYWPSCNI